MTDSVGGISPTGGRGRGFFKEIRLVLLLVALVAGGLGAYQIWDIAFAPYSFEVRITAQNDPLRTGESSAEWLLPRMEFHLRLPELDRPLAVLRPEPELERVAILRVRGRKLRRTIADGRISGILSCPGAEGESFRLALSQPTHGEGWFAFRVTIDQADGFLAREVSSSVSVLDPNGSPVRDLRTRPGVRFHERSGGQGVYDVSISLEGLLWILEEDEDYVLPVRRRIREDDESSELEIPAAFFVKSNLESRVVSLEIEGEPISSIDSDLVVEDETPDAEAGPSPAKPEPVPTSEPEPAAGAATQDLIPPPPAVDPGPTPEELLAAQLRRVRASLDVALANGHWAAAELELQSLVKLGGEDDRTRRSRQRIEDGRAREARVIEIEDLARQVQSALAAARWDQAESGIQDLEALAPSDARLSGWRARIVQARADDAAAAQQAAAEVTQNAGPTEEELIHQLLDRYVASQNNLDLDQYARVYAGLVGERRKQVERAWKSCRSQQLELDIADITIRGDRATVRCRQSRLFVPKAGSTQRHDGNFDLELEKRGGAWIMVDLRAIN